MLKFLTTGLFLLTIHIVASQDMIPPKPVSSQQITKDFVCGEIVYPADDMKNKKEGKVKLSFIVTESGDVQNLEIINSVSPAIDTEALRVFRMILWEPAEKLGQPITSKASYEFDFNIKKYKKHCKRRGYSDYVSPYSPQDTSYKIYPLDAMNQAPYPIFEDPEMSVKIFMEKHLEYPEQAFRQSISGMVRLLFIVEPHGRISNITIGQSIGGGCNEEAIRLLNKLSWMPGIVANEAVRTEMHIEITFSLPTDSQHKLFDGNQNTSM